MAKDYSNDLRKRVMAAYDAGLTYEEIAMRFAVSPSFVRDTRRLREETGDISRRPHGGGKPRCLSPKDEAAVARWCKENPELLIREYQERLLNERGVEASRATVTRTLQKLGLTRKKRVSTPQSKEPRKTA